MSNKFFVIFTFVCKLQFKMQAIGLLGLVQETFFGELYYKYPPNFVHEGESGPRGCSFTARALVCKDVETQSFKQLWEWC